MSLLKTKLLFNSVRNLSTTLPRAAAWNKDWKPGKYPQTEEERKAAAKKYGLLPEEYQPVPDDGFGAGDYPHIKPYSVESRDPFYPWDYPEYRRNHGEVIQENQMLYTEDRININHRLRFPFWQQLAMFLGTLGLCYYLCIISENAVMLPVAEKHMPKPGVKHYTYD